MANDYRKTFLMPNSTTGFSTLEIIIAVALVALGVTSAVLVSGGSHTFFGEAVAYDEALALAEQSLVEAEAKLAQNYFSDIGKTFVEDIFEATVSVENRDSFIKNVNVLVAWPNSRGGESHLSLSELVTDYRNVEVGDTCGALTGDWRAPRILAALPLSDLTDLDVVNNFVFATANSATAEDPDFYVIDVSDPANPVKVAELDTGPGLAAVLVAGRYAYLANTSVTGQLVIVDVGDPWSPAVVSKYKIPGVVTGGGKGLGRSIFYERERVYLGVTKNDGPEWNIIDVANPYFPNLLGGFETDTLVNATRLLGQLAFVATPTDKQVRILDISDPANVGEISALAGLPYPGFQDGKSITYAYPFLYFGRTAGAAAELHKIEIASDASMASVGTLELGASANEILARPPLLFIATNSSARELQIVDTSAVALTSYGSLDLPDRAFALDCDGDLIYVATDSGGGLIVVTPN